jgi:hypothetical protein
MPWFKHENMGGGYMPTLRVRLGRASANSQPIKFIVDSGAAKSLVPRGLVLSLIQDLAEEPEQPTGLLDASGKDLMGIPVDFHLRPRRRCRFPRVVRAHLGSARTAVVTPRSNLAGTGWG